MSSLVPSKAWPARLPLRTRFVPFSTAEKETLLRVLWEELDGPAYPDVEAAWLDEVRRRSDEIDSGTAKTTPSEQVFAHLREQIKK